MTNLAATGSLAWLAGSTGLCAQSAAGAYRNPVPFVNSPAAAGLSPDDLTALFAVDAVQTANRQTFVYPQSVASGDPQANGIVLWTRVDPAQQGGGYSDLIAWQIASDPGFSAASILAAGVATLDIDKDNTIKLPITQPTLQPYTGYFYRFLYNQVVSRTGQFKTLPAADADLASLNIGYVVCQDYGNGY